MVIKKMFNFFNKRLTFLSGVLLLENLYTGDQDDLNFEHTNNQTPMLK